MTDDLRACINCDRLMTGKHIRCPNCGAPVGFWRQVRGTAIVWIPLIVGITLLVRACV